MDKHEYLSTKIRPRQSKLNEHLVYDNNKLSVWTKTPSGKTLSRGCQSCKNGTWWCIYVGHICNLDCMYCPQGGIEDKKSFVDHKRSAQQLWIDDIKNGLEFMEPGTITGLSYSGGEPFLYIYKIIEIANYVSKNHPDIYQWMYTNGTLVRENALKIVADLGIREIRFHLGATNFSSDVIKNLELAKKHIPIVNVETPSLPFVKEQLIDKQKIYQLQDIGVDQINLAELYINNKRMRASWIGDLDQYYYTSIFRPPGYKTISPICSRETTYDIVEFVTENKIDILINDCSNEAKDVQMGMKSINSKRLPNID